MTGSVGYADAGMPFGATYVHARKGLMNQRDSWHGRLHSQFFWVTARVSRGDDGWVASVDTPGGRHVASGRTAVSALVSALEIFDGMSLELLNSAPPDLLRLLHTQHPAPAHADAIVPPLAAGEGRAI